MSTPIRTVTYTGDPMAADRLSRSSGEYAKQAIKAYANAAACEEAVDDGGHVEVQMWFVVRMLCEEHGIDYKAETERARKNARSVMSGMVQP